MTMIRLVAHMVVVLKEQFALQPNRAIPTILLVLGLVTM
jgi:hypothetical protein